MQYLDWLTDDELRPYAAALNARAKAVGARGQLTVAELRGIILDSGGRCAWCGKSIVGQEFEVDHIIPLAMGGAHIPDNLAACCPNCNRSKSDKHPATFAQEIYNQIKELTPLLERVFRHYNITPQVQRSLFDE